jgi:uncharacterized membrane protein
MALFKTPPQKTMSSPAGGLPAAIAIILLPVSMLLASAGFSLADDGAGQDGLSFPFFKLAMLFVVAGLGLGANLIPVLLRKRKRYGRRSAVWT